MAHITSANVTAGFHGGDAIELDRSVDNSVA
jgi:lactam utilization protein B